MKKIIILWILLIPSMSYSLPAFPGAEGFGSETVGGRGGRVYIVSNLNDSGAGSFREVCEATGPRYVVFSVSGVIELQSTLSIENPFITIAGETSPGGICIAHWPTHILAHDVVLRHLRFRIGTEAIAYDRDENGEIYYYTWPQYQIREDHDDCLSGNSLSDSKSGWPCALNSGMDPSTMSRALCVIGPGTPGWYPNADAHNVIIDHCSFSWGVDEVVLMTSGAHDITFSYNITGEGLSRAGHEKGEHSKNLALSGKFTGVYHISVHHNYLSNSHDRNTYVSGPFEGTASDPPGTRWVDIRNNVVYNFYTGGMIVQENGSGNWIGNYVRRGPERSVYAFELAFWNPAPDANNLLYVEGNIGTSRTAPSDPQWCVGNEWRDYHVTEDYKKTSPYDTRGGEVTTAAMSREYAQSLVENAGATKPVRDSVDQRLLSEWNAGTGQIPDIVFYPEDYPTYATLPPPADTDLDGMADDWELSEFGDLSEEAAEDEDQDGYDNIEEYFHFKSGIASGTATTPTPSDTDEGSGCFVSGVLSKKQQKRLKKKKGLLPYVLN